MEILEKIDWKILNKYIENKLIKINKHSKYDLWILNYTPETQFNHLIYGYNWIYPFINYKYFHKPNIIFHSIYKKI